MEGEKLAKTLSKAPNLTPEQIRVIIREEIDRKEEEKQEECDHSRSGKLVDGKKGIVRCHDCGKLLNMSESTGSPEIPPQMKARMEQKLRKKENKNE